MFKVLSTAFVVFCFSALINAAPLDYGFSRRYDHLLIHKSHGSTIKLCGGYLNFFENGIRKWGEALDRSYHFENSCLNSDIFIYGEWDSEAKRLCQEYKDTGKDLSGRAFVLSHQSPMLVVDCGYKGDLEKMALHEAGHLFGLCDQYYSEIENCRYSTSADSQSVMAAANSTSLTEDDIVGIRAFAKNITENMIDNERIKRIGSPIMMRSGTYVRKDIGSANKSWRITSVVIKGETKVLILEDDGQKYVFDCNKDFECTWNSLKIKLLTSVDFDFIKEGTSYPFVLRY